MILETFSSFCSEKKSDARFFYQICQVAAGRSHFAVVTMENELYTWATAQGGPQMVGQLGHGDTAMYKAPKRVDSFEGVPIKQVNGTVGAVCKRQLFGGDTWLVAAIQLRAVLSAQNCKMKLFLFWKFILFWRASKLDFILVKLVPILVVSTERRVVSYFWGVSRGCRYLLFMKEFFCCWVGVGLR